MLQLLLAVILTNLTKIMSSESFEELRVKRNRVRQERKTPLEEDDSDSNAELSSNSYSLQQLSVLRGKDESPSNRFVVDTKTPKAQNMISPIFGALRSGAGLNTGMKLDL